jgi:HlyD family secretion protein
MAGMKRRRLMLWAVMGVVLLTAVGAVVAASRVKLTPSSDDVPLAVVKRGEIDLEVHGRGELRASHAMMLTAPSVGGDSLQITKLVRTGAVVKKGDTIVEFDPSQQIYKMEQNRSELQQAEQEITKAKADALVLSAEDKVTLLKVGYNVRRAEMDVQKNELVSKIDADKNVLALEQAKRVVAETQKDIESHKQSGQAATYLAQEKYNKAKLAIDEAQDNLNKMHLTAPMDGVVSLQKKLPEDVFFEGMTLPDYHQGDQAHPGNAIAQVVDPAGMDLVAKIPEQERSNLQNGEAVEVQFDALPGKTFHGTVKNVGGMSVRSIFSSQEPGSFEVTMQLSPTDPRLRAGFTAQVVFLGGSRKNVLYVPRQALFMKDGKRIVFVSKSSGYEQCEVKIESQSESRAAIDGLDEGMKVALIDPTAPRKQGAGSSAPALGGTP